MRADAKMSVLKPKRGRKRTAKWNLVFSYIAQGQGIILGIVMVPLYLSHIPMAEYGAWLASGNVLLWITLIDPGINDVIKQRVASCYQSENEASLPGYVNSGLLIAFLLFILIVALGLGVSGYIGQLLAVEASVTSVLEPAFVIAVFGAALTFLSYGFGAVNTGLQASLSNGLVVNAAVFAYILVVLVLILCGFGLMALAIGQLTRGVIMCGGQLCYFFWRIRAERIDWNFRFSKLSELISLSLYTFATRMINGVNAHLTLFLVARFLSAEMTAIYDLTRRVPLFFKNFATRPVGAFVPVIAQLHGQGEIDKIRINVLRLGRMLAWLLGLYFGGMVALNGDFVALWVGPDKYTGDLVNALIGINVVVASALYALTSCSLATGDIKKNNLVQLVQGLIILPLFYFGIKWYGLTGLLLAAILPQVVTALFYYGRKLAGSLTIDSATGKAFLFELLRVTIVVVILLVLAPFLSPVSWLAFALSVLAVMALFSVSMWLLSPAFREEMSIVLRHGQSLLKKLFPEFNSVR